MSVILDKDDFEKRDRSKLWKLLEILEKHNSDARTVLTVSLKSINYVEEEAFRIQPSSNKSNL